MEMPNQKEKVLLEKIERFWKIVTRTCRENKGAVLMIIITILIFLFMFLLSYSYYNRIDDRSKDVPSTSTAEEITTPILNLPLRYFSDDDTRWGSVTTGRDSDDKNTWKLAAMEGGYQSFPTTTINLANEKYSNEILDLPTIEKAEDDTAEIMNIDDDEIFVAALKSTKEKNIKEFGLLAARFFPSQYITDIREFDVDDDGQKEKIVSLCGVWGNHCPHEIIIIKNEKIIFSTLASKLIESDIGNGFFLHWVPSWNVDKKWDTGRCCPTGYIKTRFVYEKGEFMPVYEQEVLYFQVNNTE